MSPSSVIEREVVVELCAQESTTAHNRRARVRESRWPLPPHIDHWRMVTSAQGDWFPIGVFIPPHFEFNEPETFRPTLLRHIKRDGMPGGGPGAVSSTRLEHSICGRSSVANKQCPDVPNC